MRTEPILDFAHVVANDTQGDFRRRAKIATKIAPDGSTKFFFVLNGGNTPPQFADMAEFRHLNTRLIGDVPRIPIFLGYEEAMMMQKEKLFTKEGDTLDKFFGKNVIVGKILPKTNTSLDYMHFVPPEFFANEN